jgi:hypothetical protein
MATLISRWRWVFLVVGLLCGHGPASASGSEKGKESRMHCLATITQKQPLTIYFSLYNPVDAGAVLHVPRMLLPLGAFVKVEIRTGDQIVYASHQPKFSPKLRPDRQEAYIALDPGHGYGVLLELEGVSLPRGDYTIHLLYSNLQYRGFPGQELGEQRGEITIPYHAD